MVSTFPQQKSSKKQMKRNGLSLFEIEHLESRVMLSGLTIVTHGFETGEPAPVWLASLQSTIASQIESNSGGIASGRVAQMVMKIGARFGLAGISVTDWRYANGFSAPVNQFSSSLLNYALNAEAVVAVDWAALASGDVSTSTIGNVAANYLLSGLGNLGKNLLSGPIHLIGHSRGASVMAKIAEILGQHGLIVDQLTMLDPHPVLGFLDYGAIDGLEPTSNVIFADDYWRKDSIFDPLNPFDFDGTQVDGTHAVRLSESALGGIINDPGYAAEHSDTHLWYHGTVVTSGVITDGEVTNFNPDLFGWYEGLDEGGVPRGPRVSIGYYYSRAQGGVRNADGLGESYGGGASRKPVALTVPASEAWDNVEILNLSNQS